VLAAAGGVEPLGVRAELGAGVQGLVADRQQGGGRDPVAESVRGHRRGFHVHGEGARYPQTVPHHGQIQLPVPVRGGEDDAHAAAQAAAGQLAEQQRVQRVVGDDRDAQREHVVQHAVIAHVAGRQHQVPDLLVVAQAGAVPDHQHQVGAEHGQVIGDRLGVGRTHADVHHGQAGAAGKHVVPGGHLAAVGAGPGAIRQGGPELLHVPGVVGEQHVPLEALGAGPGVVLQPVDRQGHALGPEQEQLLAPQVPAGLVDGRPEPRIMQVKRLAPGTGRDPGAVGGQSAQLPFQVPADGSGRGEFTFEHGIVRRPGPLDRQPRVAARLVGRLHGVAQPLDIGRAPAVRDDREVRGYGHAVIIPADLGHGLAVRGSKLAPLS